MRATCSPPSRQAQGPAQKADFFRLALLYAEGGFYVDADDCCLAPLSTLVPPHATLALYQEDYGTLANNFIGVAQGHPAVGRALDSAVEALNGGDTDTIWLATSPAHLTRAVAQTSAESRAARPA